MKHKYLLILFCVLFSLVINAQNRVIQILKDGDIVQSYEVSKIDSIVVNNMLETPSGLSASVVNYEVFLSWNEVDNSAYNVYRSNDDKEYTLIAENISKSEFTDINPIVGSNYYKVKAFNATHESLMSDSYEFVYSFEAPKGLKAFINDYDIVLSWDRVENCTIDVYRLDNESNYVLIAESITQNEFVDTKPLIGSNVYKIQSVNNNKKSEFSDVVRINFELKAPSGLNAHICDHAVTLEWNVMPRAVYNLYRSADNNAYFLMYENIESNQIVDTVPLKGANYYKIQAIVDNHKGKLSEDDVIVVDAPEMAVSVFKGCVNLKWDEIPFATYSIYHSLDNQNYSLLVSDLKLNEFTDSLPSVGINFYKLQVRVGDRESVLNNDYKVGVISNAPNTVSAKVEDNVIYISWDTIPNALYNIYRSSNDEDYHLLVSNQIANTYCDTMPMAGTNYYKVQTIIKGVESALSNSSAMVNIADLGMESGVYLGINAFNADLYQQAIGILNSETKEVYDAFVNTMSMGKGTLLCYSVDKAINALQTAKLPSDISTVAIVTFTDGLDQGSLMVSDKYNSDEEYLNAIKTRIDTEKINGKSLLAYSIGLRGDDISQNESNISKFRTTLKLLASEESNATEVTSMSEVEAKFKEIAEQLNQTRYLQTISLKMPGLSNGTRVRFTFDNVVSADKSELFVEGTFDLHNRSLTDIEFCGIKTQDSIDVIKGVTEGIFVTFTFENIQTESNTLISKEYIDEWYLSSESSWQINSEFDKNENSNIVNEKKSAVIMLVLDSSSSLGAMFDTAKSNAKSFISTLSGTSSNGTTEDSEDNSGPTLYSKHPIDLSLAVSFDSIRYYLTYEQYLKANLSKAVVEGIAIVNETDSFIIALDEEPLNSVYRGYVVDSLYGMWLPTHEQGIIISARWNYINQAIKDFGGQPLNSLWLNKPYYYTYNGAGRVSNGDSNDTYKIRLVRPIDTPSPIVWRDPLDLTLAVEKDGQRFYLTKEEYNAVKENAEYKKIGVLVVTGSESFIISLQNEQVGSIYYDVAISLYGKDMPSKEQGFIISARWNQINQALNDFGGVTLSSSFWLNAPLSNNKYAYYTYQGYGCISSDDVSRYTKPIRLVYPLE